MEYLVQADLDQIARDLRLKSQQVEAVIKLLDEQNTVPFITRYRKDQTGGLDEEQIRQIQDRAAQVRLLAERKQTILRSIESQGKLSAELAARIKAAETVKLLEDLYLPFKPKKQTLATVARQRGLEPLAREIQTADKMCADLDRRAADFVDLDREVPTAAEALLGAGHILAEGISERAELRATLRNIFKSTGKLVSVKVDKGEGKPPKPDAKPAKSSGKDKTPGKEYQDYFDYQEPLDKVPPHRVLAINRGERDKVLRVKIEADAAAMSTVVDEQVVPADHPHGEFLRGCGRDAQQRLIVPSLERELRRELTDRAEAHAVEVFARNLRNLLLQPPIRGRRVLAIDPGFRTGCKLAALDEFGNLLDHGVVYIIGKAEQREAANTKLAELVQQHQLGVIVIGNGTACRETEEVVAALISGPLAELPLAYVIVNEAGASVYSTSTVGREEFPEYDATLRGTISIGRRLQDPLSELVKISPQHIGVGLYQHDLKQKHLQQSLDEVVASCVNYVGVDLNTASPALLRYVSGMNQLIARRVVEHRQQHGPFKSRDQLKEVPGVGEATFTQAAGFLNVADGLNPLDATWIHPESYQAACAVLEKLECTPDALRDKQQTATLGQKLKDVNVQGLAGELGLGELTLKDIVNDLARPGRDPREDLPKPVFKRGILRIEDVKEGMELTGTILNVVDFGAFVDIGLKDSGLVHISQMANRYINNPHEVTSVGDVVRVWVLGIDKERRRVSLTMVEPGTEPPPRPPRREPARGGQGEPAARQSGGGRRDPQRQGSGDRSGRPARGSGAKRGSGPPARTGKPAGRPARPKPPAPPITQKMRQGSEPMRTFGDLMQFFEEPAKPAKQPATGKQGSQRKSKDKPKDRPPAVAEPVADTDAPPSAAAVPDSTTAPANTPAPAATPPSNDPVVASETAPPSAESQPSSNTEPQATSEQSAPPPTEPSPPTGSAPAPNDSQQPVDDELQRATSTRD